MGDRTRHNCWRDRRFIGARSVDTSGEFADRVVPFLSEDIASFSHNRHLSAFSSERVTRFDKDPRQ